MLQIGYFKAKQAFFNVALADTPQEDIDFLLRCYFPGARFSPTPIRRAEYYVQCGEIARLYGYRLWSEPLAPLLTKRAAQLALRDVTPAFIPVSYTHLDVYKRQYCKRWVRAPVGFVDH